MTSDGVLGRALRVVVCLMTLGIAACGGGGGGGSSTAPTPPPSPVTLTSLAPAALNAGATATVLTATGNGFTATSVIEWNGTALTTSYVSATSLTATIPAAELTTPGTVPVTVSNTATGGASSAVVDFTIGEQTAPTIATLAPNATIADAQDLSLVVTGTNFQPTATVFWNGSALQTQFDSATQVVGQVSSAQLASAGSAVVTVVNDSAAGGTSNVVTFTIASLPPAPTLTALSPASIRQNQGNVTITLTGTNFTPTTQVSYSGLGYAQTTYVSPTQLSFTFTTSLSSPYAGSAVSISVTDPASGNVSSNALPLAVTAAAPITSSISPSSVFVDQGTVAVTVIGQFFTPTSIVYVNGNARPTTLNNNNGQLIAQLSALDVSTVGSAAITVEDSASGNVASNPVTLTVQPLPNLSLSSLSPTTVPAGNGAFTLTVVGNGFSTASAIAWNGAPLPTTYVSVTLLTASVTAAQVATVGTVPVTVVNPANQGGVSASIPLSVVAPSIDAVSYQIDNGHSGSITFQSASLPSTPAWSVNVGGTPSYAVIVSNRVYVMANNNGNSELFALDSASGATLWGPQAFSGPAGITYDNGMLFINSGSYISNGVLTALDAATGAMKWSATIPGQFATQSPPVASQGIVYILEDGDLTAYTESNGAQVWQQYPSGTNGSVAVTVDGVYTAAPCTPNDYRPLTGTVIWSTNTGCEGGGGNTPVVGSGRVYAPISPGGGYGGNVYDSESGAVLSAFNYSVAPAISATHAYVMYNSTLQGITLSNNQVNWSFAGDGTLVTSPIVVNNYVFIGSSSGNLYGLDATTGSLLWTQNLGAAVVSPENGGNALQGYSGLSAGDGVLVVPAGNTVTAYVLSTNP